MSHSHYIQLQPNLSGDAVRHMLKGRMAYPLDLPALGYCEQEHLPYKEADIFYDQENYNRIFSEIVLELLACMFDRDLFKETLPLEPGQPNPLFIPIYPLIVLYGTIIHKIYEIEQILLSADPASMCLLESVVANDTDLPVTDYLDILSMYFTDRFRIHTPSQTSPPPKDRPSPTSPFRNIFSRAYCWLRHTASSLWHPDATLFLMSNITGVTELQRQLKRSSRILYWSQNTPPPPKGFDEVIGRTLPCISERLRPKFRFINNAHRFESLIRQVYTAHQAKFETAVQALIPHPPKKSPTPRHLIVRLTMDPAHRAFIYKKYLEGYRIVSQEYSDGPNVGIYNELGGTYRLAPLASLMVYANAIGEQAHFPMLQHYGVLPSDARAVSVAPAASACAYAKPQCRRIYYLPTNYSGHLRLGPHRELNDVVYWRVQQKILNVLTSSQAAEIVFKAHPKEYSQKLEDFQKQYLADRGIRLSYDRFEELLNDREALVVTDYFASSAYKCLGAGMPVIHLDFGIRRFFDQFIDESKYRVRWIKGSITSDDWQDTLEKELQAVFDQTRDFLCPRQDDTLELARIGQMLCEHP